MTPRASPRPPDDGLQRAIAKMGSANALAMALGMTSASLSEWWRIPSHRILQVEKITGISREELRPDLYDKEEPPP